MKEDILGKGVVLVDKPAGMTSFDVVEKVCEKLGIEKAGHTGTLDPNVTGLLVIALSEARKAMPLMVGMDKVYEGTMLLHGDAERKEVVESFRRFTGVITQLPPVKSRVARRERERRVDYFRLESMEGREVTFTVKCEAGTYIRKLVHDMGEHMGCGAHMTRLRRTEVGPFRVSESLPLAGIKPGDAMPLGKALDRMGVKRVAIKDETAAGKIRNGSPVFPDWFDSGVGIEKDERVAICDPGGEVIAIGTFLGKGIRTDRVLL